MRGDALVLPDPEARRRHVVEALVRYWPGRADALQRLPQPAVASPVVAGPLRLVPVPLPSFAREAGVDGVLLVPREACAATGDAADWRTVDWWLAAFLLLEGWHERAWERAHGPIHSYAWRLRGWDERAWQRAWVNRIALWLRLASAHAAGRPEDELFGARPAPRIDLTHDVDAIAKTLPIRLKQSAFLAFNAMRLAVRGRIASAAGHLGRAARFLLGREDWWMLDRLRAAEASAGVRSTFHFFAASSARDRPAWLFDPGYDVASPRVAAFVRDAAREGWCVGLHPSFAAWRSAVDLRRQRERLEAVVQQPVVACRQHWLRFGWDETWAAQADAGLQTDATLMFNDRCGLRTSTAVAWHPWDAQRGAAHAIVARPTVLMDSHLYDYAPLDAAERRRVVRHWLGEIAEVGGEAAVLWHPHTLTRDYGWSNGFDELLSDVKGLVPCPSA